MSTQAQIDANRANARHSTGPKSPEGKQAVAKNRITHGLTGRAVLIPGEDPEEFQRLSFRLKFELAPGNEVEETLVQRIANLQWRLNRVAEWTGQLTTECLEGDPAQPSRLIRMFSKTSDPCDAYNRLHKHEASLARQHQAALRELRVSKEERSKMMTGRNPAAALDFAEVVTAARAFCEAHGVDLPPLRDSNPIPAPSPVPARSTTLPRPSRPAIPPPWRP
jgi:hypothetical protein